MDGFGVPVEDVAAAGEAAMRVADGVRLVDLSAPTGALAAALPGGTVAQVVPDVGRTWTAAVGTLADGLTGQARSLSDAVIAYAEAEALVAASLAGTR